MPRACLRSDCRTALVKKDGTPDFRRIFCTKRCRLADDAERLRSKRNVAAKGKCPYCGRRSSGDARFIRSVSQDTPHKTGVNAKGGRGPAKTKERLS